MAQVFPDGVRQHVLVVTDVPEAWATVAPLLQDIGCQLSWAVSSKHALVRLQTPRAPWRLLLCDLKDDEENLAAAETLLAHDPSLTVVLACNENGIGFAVRALRAGVAEVLERPFEVVSMVEMLVRISVSTPRMPVSSVDRFDTVLGESTAIRELVRTMERIADRDFTVMLTGEAGSGKELIARALHAASRRSAGPFVAVSCAALQESMLDSEFFGHVANAFTDAGEEKLGLFRAASGGTLFLDQIGELPKSLQPRLLRVLQERTVRPLGASCEVPIDVRVICSTVAPLKDAVDAGHFREDLYFRLDVMNVGLPALRTRGSDVLLLADHFLAQHARRTQTTLRHLSLEAAAHFLEYEWPGNVRELFNVLENVLAMAQNELIEVGDLPHTVASASRPQQSTSDSGLRPWAEVEKGYILEVMSALKGNKRQAALTLGLDRTTLYRKLQGWT